MEPPAFRPGVHPIEFVSPILTLYASSVLVLLLSLLAGIGLRAAQVPAKSPEPVPPPAATAAVQPVGDPAWKLGTFPKEDWPKGEVPEAEALVEQAKQKLRFGSTDFPGAVELLKKAVALDPKHPYAWWRLGSLEVAPPLRYQEGLAMMRTQVEVAPSATAYKHGGYIMYRAGYSEQALPFFREGVAKYPEDRELAALLGETLLTLKKYDEAAAVLAAELAKYPNSSRLHLNLARALLRGGHGDEAATHFRSAVTFEPGPGMWNAVVSTLADAGSDLDYADALSRQAVTTMEATSAAWTARAAVDPNSRRALDLLAQSWRVSGWTSFKRGDLDTARSRLQAALELSLSADDAYRLGQVEEASKNVPGAAMAYGLAVLWSRPPNNDAVSRLMAIMATVSEEDAAKWGVENRSRDLQLHIVQRAGRDQAQAGFVVVVDASGVVREAAADPSGPRSVGDADAILRLLVGVQIGPKIPWNADARTLRRGGMVCDAQQPVCRVTMFSLPPPLAGQ